MLIIARKDSLNLIDDSDDNYNPMCENLYSNKFGLFGASPAGWLSVT